MIFTALRPWFVLLLAVAMLGVASDARSQSADKELVTKGQYIFAIAGGCACHSDPKGTVNVGARAFTIPLGTVYSTNLTADKETGLEAGAISRFATPSPPAFDATAAD